MNAPDPETVLERVTDGFFALDRAWRFTYVNNRTGELLAGLRPERSGLIGKVIWEEFPDLVGSGPFAAFRKAVAEQRPVRFEANFHRLERWLALTVYPDDQGLSVYFADVTERKRAERERSAALDRERRARREAEETALRLAFLQQITAAFADALTPGDVATILLDRGLPAIGAEAGTIALLTAEGDLLTLASRDWNPHDAPARFPVTAAFPLAQAVRAGVTEGPVWTMVVGGGASAAADAPADRSAIAALALLAHGRIVGGIALRRAETLLLSADDRRLLETIARQCAHAMDRALLLERERQARATVERIDAERAALLAQVADGIILANPAGTISYANDAARRMHGVDLLDGNLDDFPTAYGVLTEAGHRYPPEEFPLARALLTGETVVDAEWRIRRPDGSHAIVQGTAAPVRSERGEQLGAVLTLRDVTARYRLEQQRTAFVSAVTHDLKTPLTTIRGFAQLLQRWIAQPENCTPKQMAAGLERIEAAAGSMLSQVSELLDLARGDAGRPLDLELAPSDLITMIEQVASDARATTRRHSIEVHTAVPSLICTVDPARLRRAVGNLIVNAIKYSPNGGLVTIAVAHEPPEAGPHPRVAGWARITVHDEGMGVPTADLPRIFDRFHRGGNAIGTSGAGIGLASARSLVERHGGTLNVDSSEGKGSTFTIRLPLDGRGRPSGHSRTD